MIMRILVASDSFKGTLSSREIGRMVQEVWSPRHQVDYLAVSDGGEGFLEAMEEAGAPDVRAVLHIVSCRDPLGRSIEAAFMMIAPDTAIIESARVSGLPLLADDERNPLLAGTYGLGQMIAAAVAAGARNLYVGLGGSATNDGGVGMLRALGWRFFDADDVELEEDGGQILERIHRIDASAVSARFTGIKMFAVCDVDNPLLGSRGATMVYGRQKGASAAMLTRLEKGMKKYADAALRASGRDDAGRPGTGAAGGLGFALCHFMKAEILPGIGALMKAMNLEGKMTQYDLIVTGEGKLDIQTESGKVPMGILKLAQKHGIPVICLCGVNELKHNPGFAAIHSVVPDIAPLEESLRDPRAAMRALLRSISPSQKRGTSLGEGAGG